MRIPHGLVRRRALASLTAWIAAPALGAPAGATEPRFAPVERPARLTFPRDHGAHPQFRTEWWYATGWADTDARDPDDRRIGFQLTFFRSRTAHSPDNPSRFAPRQLVLAHAAIACPTEGRLLHDQRAFREGFGLASFDETDTRLQLPGWRFERRPDDRYVARLEARQFTLELQLQPRSPPLLQGDAGFSRKGPNESQASYYYSRPQLAVGGRLEIRADAGVRSGPRALSLAGGVGWLDHEWSSEILDAQAQGWDWAGLNLDDGSAIMAFRIRRRDGSTLWASANPAGAVAFEPLRSWQSPRTGIRYPVAIAVTVAGRRLELRPLLDDQELDSRASTGTVYWEGAVQVLEAGRHVGRGYLELTGYGEAMRI